MLSLLRNTEKGKTGRNWRRDGVIYMTNHRVDSFTMWLLGSVNRPLTAVPEPNPSGTHETSAMLIPPYLSPLRQHLSLNLEWSCQPESLSVSHVSVPLRSAGLLAYEATPSFYVVAEDLNMHNALTLGAISFTLYLLFLRSQFWTYNLFMICWSQMLNCLFKKKSYPFNTSFNFS